MKIKILLEIALCLLVGNVHAQYLTVQAATGQNPSTLINQHLAGQGVVLSNGMFNNSAGNISVPQIGTFSYNGNAFPFHSGLILTTGNVSVAPGPNSGDGTADQVPDNQIYWDPLLAQYATDSLFACSVLDFDFVAFADTFAFNYIFASDEYPEYVCSEYNDVFVFLLTGYDPVTHATTTKNIAIIPNTITAATPNGVPVTINAVNIGQVGSEGGGGVGCYYQYSQYYNSNNSNVVEYDGYTTALVATAPIEACQTYHMHLSIGNVGDNNYDSGVFLEEGSFYSPSSSISQTFHNLDLAPSVQGDTLIQNCREVNIDYHFPDAILSTYHLDIGFEGSGVLNQDYELSYLHNNNWQPLTYLNNTIALNPGDSVIHLQMKALPNTPCNGGVKEARIIITTILCENLYYGGQQDAGQSDTLVYHLLCNPPFSLSDTTMAYCHDGGSVTVGVQGDPNQLHYQWTPTNGLQNPFVQSPTANITQSTTFQVRATDAFNCHSDTAQVHVEIQPLPVANLHIEPDFGCAPLNVILRNQDIPDGCNIRWHVYNENSFDTTNTAVNPLRLRLDDAGYYDVNLWLSSAPGCSDSINIHHAIHVSLYPHADFTYSPEEPHNGETVYFYDASTGDNITSYHWSFGDGNTSTTANPEHSYHVPATDLLTVRFEVTNSDGCADDTTVSIPVIDDFALYVPNSFTPNEDGINDVFQPKVSDVAYYRLEIYDRYGNKIFVTEDPEGAWDGTINGKPAPTSVFSWTIHYTKYSNLTQQLVKKGSVTLVR